jgi:DNA-binding NarL/FixJ family response regulator
VRQGLQALLGDEPDFQVVGEASDGLEAVQMVERLRPDVLVLDLMMPGLNGLEVVRQVTMCCPKTRVIILSMYTNPGYVLEALNNGAAGYVLKKGSVDQLVQAVRQVMSGRRYLSPPLSEDDVQRLKKETADSHTDPYDLLTSRQRVVLQLIVEGHTNAEIAARLVISPRTVEFHRSNLMRKLGARSQVDLIRIALQSGILPPESDL